MILNCPVCSFLLASVLRSSHAMIAISDTFGANLEHPSVIKRSLKRLSWKFFSIHGIFFPCMEKKFHAWKKQMEGFNILFTHLQQWICMMCYKHSCHLQKFLSFSLINHALIQPSECYAKKLFKLSAHIKTYTIVQFAYKFLLPSALSGGS